MGHPLLGHPRPRRQVLARYARRAADRPGLVQAAYYLVSGTWPLVAYRSFEAVTGPKREPWLVKMVGLLTMVIGGVIATDPAGRTPQTRRLAIGAAVAYATVDVWYAAVRRRIRPIYLMDAMAEAALAGAWLARRHR